MNSHPPRPNAPKEVRGAESSRPPWVLASATILLIFLFLALLQPTFLEGVPRIGQWLALNGQWVALIPIALIGWLCFRAYGAAIGLIGGFLLIVSGVILTKTSGFPHALTLIALAVLGSLIGSGSYILISLLGKWNDMEDEIRNDPFNGYLRCKLGWILEDLQEMRLELKSDIDNDRSEWLQSEMSAKEKDLRSCSEELLDRDPNQELRLQRVTANVSWARRLLRVPMAASLAIGLSLLGSLVGLDILEAPPTGEDLRSARLLGFFYLVGLYPRVFEKYLKAIADKLTGAKDES